MNVMNGEMAASPDPRSPHRRRTAMTASGSDDDDRPAIHRPGVIVRHEDRKAPDRHRRRRAGFPGGRMSAAMLSATRTAESLTESRARWA